MIVSGDIGSILLNEVKYITFQKAVDVDTITRVDGKEVNIYSGLKFVDTMNFMLTL